MVILLFLFYPGIFLVKGAWLISDHAEQHFPWAYYLAEQLKAGVIPFWTHMIHSGFPITAEGQIGSFYLPNLLFQGLLPIRPAYAWNIVFHLLLSSFFMYGYLRSLQLSRTGAVFGAVVYLFGSTLGGAYYNITSLKVLTWFPLTLILADRLIQERSIQWGRVLLLGFVFSLQILVGYLQYAAYAILFTLLYFIFRYFESNPFRSKNVIVPLFSVAAALLLGAFIASPQILLTFELALHSNRAGLSEESFAYIGSYSPLAVSCLLFPSLEPLFASKLYLGIIPLFFICVSLASLSRHPQKVVIFLFLIALILALGNMSPLYVAIVKFFKFYSFRTPVKFIFFAGFFLTVLAASGMDCALSGIHIRRVIRGARIYFAILLVSILGVVVSFLIFRFFQEPLYQLGEWIVQKTIYGKPGHPFGWEHYEAKLSEYVTYAQFLLNPLGKIILVPVIKIILAVTLIGWFLKRQFKARKFILLAFILMIVDLYAYSFADVQRDYAPYKEFFKENASVRFLKDQLGKDRYFIYSVNPSEAPLPAGKNMIYGLNTANAYSPLIMKDYYDFFSSMGGINDSNGYHPIEDTFFYDNLKLLGMLNVKYIMSDRDLKAPTMKKIFTEESWTIYENSLRMNEMVLVREYEVYSDHDQIMKTIRSIKFDPAKTVLIEKEPIFYGDENAEVKGDRIMSLTDKPEHRDIEVLCTEDMILVIAQLFFPGWEATVDGQKAELYRVNAILTGIPLRKGRHQITLKYAPFRRIFD